MRRTNPRSRRAYLELVDVLKRAGVPVEVGGEGVGIGSFWTPTHRPGIPLQLVFTYPGRLPPGPALLDAYRRAADGVEFSRQAWRSRIAAGVAVFSPSGRGVREHIVAMSLPDLLRLLHDAGKLKHG